MADHHNNSVFAINSAYRMVWNELYEHAGGRMGTWIPDCYSGCHDDRYSGDTVDSKMENLINSDWSTCVTIYYTLNFCGELL